MQKTLNGKDVSDAEWRNHLKQQEDIKKLADKKLSDAKKRFKENHPVKLPKKNYDPSRQKELIV